MKEIDDIKQTNQFQVSELLHDINKKVEERVAQIIQPAESELASEFREAAEHHRVAGRQQTADMFATVSFLIKATPEVMGNAFATSAGAMMVAPRNVLRTELAIEMSRAFRELADGLDKIDVEPDLFIEGALGTEDLETSDEAENQDA